MNLPLLFMIDDMWASCYIWTHFMKTFLALNGNTHQAG